MDIQPLGQTGTQSVRRQDLAVGPLGTVGNLRFTPRQGGTAPVAPPGAAANVSSSWANLQFALSGAPVQARKQREILLKVRANSRSIGDLLGRLTAPTGHARALAAIAQDLARLSKISRGDLAALPGGREALTAYMSELDYLDLVALRHGALGHADARNAVLNQVSPGLREQAAHLLQQIEAALELRSAQEVVLNPLWGIGRLLFASSLDAQELEIQLDKLYSGLAMLDSSGTQNRASIVHMLDVYLQSLPDDQFEVLLAQIHSDALDAAEDALSRRWDARTTQAAKEKKNNDPSLAQKELWLIKLQFNFEDYLPFSMLVHLRAALEREICARLHPSMLRLELALMSAVSLGKRLVASRVLLDMNALLDRIQRTYRALPEEMVYSVSKQLQDSFSLFRNKRLNREGALNADSLRELDDITLVNLRRATQLHPLGLTLDFEAIKQIVVERMEPLRQRFNAGARGVFWALSKDPMDMPLLMRRLQDLSDVELDYIRQLEDLGHFDDGGPALVDRRGLVRDMCERAVGELFREAPAFMEQDAMKHMELLRGLASKYSATASKLEGIIVQGDFEEGGRMTKEQLDAACYLVNDMGEALHQRLMVMAQESHPDAIGGLHKHVSTPKKAESSARVPPGTFYPGLRELYGVAYGLTANEIALLATDKARARMVPELEALLPVVVPVALEAALPANESDQGLTVRERLRAQEIEDAGILFSVRGSGSGEQPIRFMWPGSSVLENRRHTLESALDALVEVAGPQAEALMHLMRHEDTHAAVARGLKHMGMDSPFRLRDGTVVHVAGAGPVVFDVAKIESGDFLVRSTVRFSDLTAVPARQPDGMDAVITMNPWTSWAEVRYVLHVSADVQEARVIGLPQFRHHFELVKREIVVTV